MIDNRLLNSPEGPVIHNEVALADMPDDEQLLVRSAKAYWDQTVEGTYQEKLMPSRLKSTEFCEKLWQLGRIELYPRGARQLAALKYAFREYELARTYQEYWIEHNLYQGTLSPMAQDLFLYLEEMGGDWDKVMDWCRRRAEQDRTSGADPVGMILLRHFMRIWPLSDERREGEKSEDYWVRLYRRYPLVKISAHLLIVRKFWRGSAVSEFGYRENGKPANWELHKTRNMADKSDLIALGNALDEEWVFDTPEKKETWRAAWKECCSAIKAEEAGFGSDWFEKEQEAADRWVRKQKENGRIRRHGRELYIAGLAEYAIGNKDAAIALMQQAADNRSYEAKGWLVKHCTPEVESNYADPYPELMEMEELSDQLYDTPDKDGMRKLAKLIEQGNELASGQPDVADLLQPEIKKAREQEKVLRKILSTGRRNAYALADQMLEEGQKNPQMASDLLWYVLLVRMHLARTVGTGMLREAVDFVSLDMGHMDEYDRLADSARDDENWDAVYQLCEAYSADPRLEVNPYLSDVVYHLGQGLCRTYRDIYFRIPEPETREKVLKDWIRIMLLMGADGDPEPVAIGLYQEDPYCCSLLEDVELVKRMDLQEEQVIRYLHRALNAGYPVKDALDQRIGSKQDVYTEDYFDLHSRNHQTDREQARAWMADLEQAWDADSIHQNGREA